MKRKCDVCLKNQALFGDRTPAGTLIYLCEECAKRAS